MSALRPSCYARLSATSVSEQFIRSRYRGACPRLDPPNQPHEYTFVISCTCRLIVQGTTVNIQHAGERRLADMHCNCLSLPIATHEASCSTGYHIPSPTRPTAKWQRAAFSHISSFGHRHVFVILRFVFFISHASQ